MEDLGTYYCHCQIGDHKYYCESSKEPPTIFCQNVGKIINLEDYGHGVKEQ